MTTPKGSPNGETPTENLAVHYAMICNCRQTTIILTGNFFGKHQKVPAENAVIVFLGL